MADRKISELSLASTIDQDDFYHVVTSTGSTPTNQKVRASTIHRADYTANNTYSVITQSILTQGATGQSLGSGHFRISADNNYGGDAGQAVLSEGTALLADVILGDVNGNVTVATTATAVRTNVDYRNTNQDATVYSTSIEFSDSSSLRAYSPTAFIKLQDTKSASTANVSYVFDLFPETAYGASAGQNTGPAFTSGTNVGSANGAILIRVAGEDKYIMLHDAIN